MAFRHCYLISNVSKDSIDLMQPFIGLVPLKWIAQSNKSPKKLHIKAAQKHFECGSNM